MGGWSQSRARDNLINDSFAAFVVHLKHDSFQPDDKEIQEARFFEWRPLLDKWRAADRPKPQQGGSKSLQVAELGLPDVIVKGKAEGRNAVALNVLQWLDAYERGGGLYCVHQSYSQGHQKASKVQYVGYERPPTPTPTPTPKPTQTPKPKPTQTQTPAVSWAPEEA